MNGNGNNGDTITILGEEIQVRRLQLKHQDLCFYPDNPRVYSLLGIDNSLPAQDEIEKCLIQMDHVRQLVQSIKSNGGLIDPLIVRGKDNTVLEGNSRLAAYRLLSRSNPVKWAMVKCLLLPEDISDDRVFALLGEYHIIGRKDWAPFEQAGYLWRRFTRHNISPEQMQKEMGLSAPAIKQMIDVYQFMVDHREVDPQKWSYYEEYLKSRAIGAARAMLPELDDVVVQQIRSGKIAKAVEVRDRLSKVCAAKGKAIRRFVERRCTLEESYEEVVAGGANNVLYQRLHRFREQIKSPDAKKEIVAMPTNIKQKCKYELEKIYKRAKELYDLM